MITQEQAQEYLDTVGVELPSFLLAALVSQTNSVNECLQEHYDPDTALLIQCYLLALLALGQGDKYLSSRTGPNGASQSFRYMGFSDRWSSLMSLLRALDKYGCATGLIPADPTKKSAGLWVSRGGCYCGGR